MVNSQDVETFESGLESKVRWLKLLVSPNGLNYSNQPKGLLMFHKYETVSGPIDEHLKEAMGYAQKENKCRVHFTVSPEHQSSFESVVSARISEPPFSAFEWEIEFSHQDPETDTYAVDEQNKVVNINGKELRRPGGHGALIHNLNKIDADVVFIKNIDNVVHDRLLETTVAYKKAIGGVLLELRDDLQNLNNVLKKGLLDEMHIQELRDKWKIRIPKDYKKLKAYLARPIRVCGMVKNEGEPGGGPFYSHDKYTGESLQIIEQAQVNTKDSRQQGILASSSHFNPVDLVCCIKDLEGRKIDLLNYVDNALYFISPKSVNGRDIKALEWPGLWNGAMAHWITLFVEVPIVTFNPVKEISDLLRPTHLAVE